MLKNYSLYFAWLISLIGTLATLYLSEVLAWPVCHLCWYQRICLFPLTIILGIACFRDDKHIVPYILPLPIIGAVFSLYQYLEQMIPGFAPINVCGAGPSCSDIHLQLLGFITLPLLGLIGFLVQAAFLWLARRGT